LVDRPSVDQMKAEVTRRLAIETVFGAGVEKDMTVIETRRWRQNGSEAREILLVDDLVGEIKIILLVPNGLTPIGGFPAVIGLHGHPGCAEDFLHNFNGDKLARQGFVVLMPSFRVMCADGNESRLAKSALQHGTSLLAIRVYETIRALTYLKTLDYVNPTRISLIGHSGGGSIANVMRWLDVGLAAVCLDDWPAKYFQVGQVLSVVPGDAMPALPDISRFLISDVEKFSPIPTKVFPYGFPEGVEPIVSFLRSGRRGR